MAPGLSQTRAREFGSPFGSADFVSAGSHHYARQGACAPAKASTQKPTSYRAQCSSVAKPTPLTQNTAPQLRKRSRLYQARRSVLLAVEGACNPTGCRCQGGCCPLTAPAAAHAERGLPMETDLTFMDCPAYMDKRGTARCGLPAEVECRYTVRSTDGPLESARIRCPRGHWFNGLVESLTWDKHPAAAIPQPADIQSHRAASLPARKTQAT